MSRPWHVPLPGSSAAPWPNVQPSVPPTRAEVGRMVTAARERAERRRHGAK